MQIKVHFLKYINIYIYIFKSQNFITNEQDKVPSKYIGRIKSIAKTKTRDKERKRCKKLITTTIQI